MDEGKEMRHGQNRLRGILEAILPSKKSQPTAQRKKYSKTLNFVHFPVEICE
jgi:hypothetical protein